MAATFLSIAVISLPACSPNRLNNHIGYFAKGRWAEFRIIALRFAQRRPGQLLRATPGFVTPCRLPCAYHMSQRKSHNDKDGQGLAELAAPSSRRENPRWSKWNIVKGRDNPSDYET